jgi:hypothetical protein
MDGFRSFVIDGALTALALFTLGCSKEPASVVKDLKQEVTSATVESVYMPERLVSLRTDDGRLVAVVAGPEVRNLDRVRVGDRVVVHYYAGIAAHLKKPGEGLSGPRESTVTARAEPGQRPAAAAGSTQRTIVTIESIDRTLNTVSFRRPDGVLRSIALEDPQVREFARKLKPGDQVEVTYTEAVAVAVAPQIAVKR